jgi:hypothetical protein
VAVNATPADRARLRRLVLAVSVLEDLDLDPADDGVALPRHRDVRIAWDDVLGAVGPNPLESTTARHRLATWLRLRITVAELADELGAEAAAVLRQAARALALPPDHAVHPGAGWAIEPLRGGALECGVALLGVLDDPTEVVPLPPAIARCAGADTAAWWPGIREHAEGMGHLAVQRLRRDQSHRQQVLRPVGGVDVPTLLMSPVLRRYLAESDGSGMRALAVPMRSRGWFDLARIDPAFVGAAWSATQEEQRGLAAPVLVTADEVGTAPHGGDVREALADPVSGNRWRDDVRYR